MCTPVLYLIAVNFIFVFFCELCGQMPESKTPVLDKKRPVDEVDIEIVKLRAFAETGFQHWIKRVQGECLAKRASALTMEWQKEGKNVLEMLAGMATLLQVGLQPEHMLDLVVAWEDVASVKYDCAAMKFRPTGTQMGGGAPTGAPHVVDFLHQENADLRRKLDAQSAAKSKSKSAKTNYPKGVLTTDLIGEFLQEPAIPEWMDDLCKLPTKALDEELPEDPSVPAQDLWKLLINKYNEYDKRYHKGRGPRRRRSSSRPKSQQHRSSSSSHKGKKSRRSRRSRSSSTESSSGSGSDSGEETYYRGKFKFTVRDGVEFLIANNGREWRTDKRPPGDCIKCGGRH